MEKKKEKEGRKNDIKKVMYNTQNKTRMKEPPAFTEHPDKVIRIKEKRKTITQNPNRKKKKNKQKTRNKGRNYERIEQRSSFEKQKIVLPIGKFCKSQGFFCQTHWQGSHNFKDFLFLSTSCFHCSPYHLHLQLIRELDSFLALLNYFLC